MKGLMSSASRMSLSILLLAPALAVCATAWSSTAHAEDRPITGYQWADPAMVDISEPTGHTSNIIFLNRCQGGCTINSGFGDSRTNTSSIIRGSATISEWNKGDAQWEELVSCVTALYDPYDIVITDVDPGTKTPHF